MANINQADAERVLKIIESLVEHVPEHIRLELDSLVGLLKSPLFYQYLDYQELLKISQLSHTGDLHELCETVQRLKLSVEIESCSNISTEECTHNLNGEVNDNTLIDSATLKQDDTLTSPQTHDTLEEGSNYDRESNQGSDRGSIQGNTLEHTRSSNHANTRTRGKKSKVSIKRESITLDRTPGESLGFDVCGTVHSDNPGPVRVFVQKITPQGLADRDGRLQTGDEIVAINSESISDNDGGPEAMQQVLEKIGQIGSVTFTIKRKLVTSEPAPIELPAPVPNPLSLANRRLVVGADGELLVPVQCSLVSPATGLGFGIVDDIYGNVRVNTILPDTPVDKEGTLQLQDVILGINEAMVRGLNQQHIARLLQCAAPNINLLVGRPVHMDVDKCTVSSLENITWKPLTRCEQTGGVKVLAAPANCVISKDDVIIQVNGVSLELLSVEELEEVLACGGHVIFVNNSNTHHHVDPMQESVQMPPESDRITNVWEPNIQYVEFEKRNATLGITISPLIDPLDVSRTIIVIDNIQEDSGIAEQIKPGSRLISINDKVFNDCSFDVVTCVMKMTPEGPVRLGVRPLIEQPEPLVDSENRELKQSTITVSNNADFPGITLKPSSHSLVPGFVVCSVLPGGLFDVDGRLGTGDIIVSLNYTGTVNMTLGNIRTMIENSCKSASLLRVCYVEKGEAEQEYTVIVPRHPMTGIGICIIGGATQENPTQGVYIKKIVDIKSSLKSGEQILKVNDISMVGKTHEEAVEILKTALSPITLTLLSAKQVSTRPGEKYVENELGGAVREDTETDNLLHICLPTTREVLGMSMGTCEQGLLVTSVEENSVADVINLKAGDIIFKVNGTVLRGVPQDMMIPILRQQDGPTNVTVVRKPPRKSQVTPINSAPGSPALEAKHEQLATKTHDPNPNCNNIIDTPPNTFTVNIKKRGTSSLGINVVQRGNGIFVKNIVPDFPASECEKLRAGDQIVAVNEHSLTGISRIKAIAVLRKVEGDVRLLLTRPNLAIATVVASSSDKENCPSRSPSPYVELEALGTLQSPAPGDGNVSSWQRDSVRSSEPDIAPLKRTDNMTPDNISLRSHHSENRYSNGGSRNSLDKFYEVGDKGSAALGDKARSHTPPLSLRHSPVLKRATDTDSNRADDVRAHYISDVMGADKRISWHDTPIEVDTVTVRITNCDSGSGIVLISQPHPDGILVKQLNNNSPAGQLVWPQDIITRLNGVVTRDMAVSDAAIALTEKASVIDLEIKRDSPLYQTHTVTLEKPKSGSLGLSITERRSLPGIYISAVAAGGVAESQGTLEKGQRILCINGLNVKYMRQSDFINILKGSGKSVELTMGSTMSDPDNRSQASSTKYSPAMPERPRSSNSMRSSQQSRGSIQSSHRATSDLARQSPQFPSNSPPQFPGVSHSHRSPHNNSPHGSPRLAHRPSPHGSPRLSHRTSPHGSPRSSVRSTHTPVGSLRGSQMSHHSQREPCSQHGAQRDANSQHGSQRSSPRSVHSQRSAHPTEARHPSPSRTSSRSAAQSVQSKRSNINERDLRAGSMQYSVASIQSDYEPGNNVHSMATHSLDNRSLDNRSLDNRSNLSSSSYNIKPKPPVLRTANLYREKSAPLGLSLGGGRGWPLGSIPLFISSLQKGGIAARTHVLKEKDRIVSINGTNVEEFSHEDAVNLLREATSPVTLVVTDPDIHRPDFRMVKLTRSVDGFGFSIVGGSDNIPPLPITIKQVYETGPAFGKLKRGDQIISVNGRSIEDYTRENATSLLKACTETVTLVIQ